METDNISESGNIDGHDESATHLDKWTYVTHSMRIIPLWNILHNVHIRNDAVWRKLHLKRNHTRILGTGTFYDRARPCTYCSLSKPCKPNPGGPCCSMLSAAWAIRRSIGETTAMLKKIRNRDVTNIDKKKECTDGHLASTSAVDVDLNINIKEASPRFEPKARNPLITIWSSGFRRRMKIWIEKWIISFF